MRELRVKCKQCGERFTVYRIERERTPAYCDACKEDRRRDQARTRMQTMRARRAATGAAVAPQRTKPA